MSMFWDAIDPVSLPNALGMSQQDDGGFIGTKPYAASDRARPPRIAAAEFAARAGTKPPDAPDDDLRFRQQRCKMFLITEDRGLQRGLDRGENARRDASNTYPYAGCDLRYP
jgi:hypothetical protein